MILITKTLSCDIVIAFNSEINMYFLQKSLKLLLYNCLVSCSSDANNLKIKKITLSVFNIFVQTLYFPFETSSEVRGEI